MFMNVLGGYGYLRVVKRLTVIIFVFLGLVAGFGGLLVMTARCFLVYFHFQKLDPCSAVIYEFRWCGSSSRLRDRVSEGERQTAVKPGPDKERSRSPVAQQLVGKESRE